MDEERVQLDEWAREREIQIIRAINISKLIEKENRGFPYAIIIGKALPKSYISENFGKDVAHDIFIQAEHCLDEQADELAERICRLGYRAISQSERRIGERKEFEFETKTSFLPHKKIAVLAGLGWIGKNNLLITEDYGPALCLCSVLTNYCVGVKSYIRMESKCHICKACVNHCPTHVLKNKEWTVGTCRDEIVDVYQCEACLKCLVHCQYAIKYSRS